MDTPHSEYRIEAMSRADLDVAIDWAAKEGWNPGLEDDACFFAQDPGGFFLGRLGDEPVSSISAVRYAGGFGFVGFYIVTPEHRGEGLGVEMWKRGMEFLEGRNVALDGVVDQQPNYRKSGFVLAGRNIRHEGRTVAGERGARVVELSDLDPREVHAYDTRHHFAPRPEFLEAWLTRPGTVALGALEGGRLVGTGVLRPCRSGYKVGPLFAGGARIAEELFLSLSAAGEPDRPLYLDTPEDNAEAVRLAERHGMKPVFETARMYTGPFPDLPLEEIFGITSFELG